MKIKKRPYGTLSTGEEADLYILKAGDLSLGISTWGGTLVSLIVPSRSGKYDDVLLGYSTFDPYTRKNPYFGATIGRYANRIGDARFSLDGTTYALAKNNGANTLHGGLRGFDKYVWAAEAFEEKGGVYLRLTLASPDGDEGYPGNLKATVVYGLTGNDELVAEYKAKVDAPCPVNLTNHAYFNLRGSGDILGHEVALSCSSYVPVGAALLPTGEIAKVEGTPFDFSKRKSIGKDLKAAGGGYDHCFAVDGKPGELRPCAEVYEPSSGRTMRLSTTQPGVQFYTGNFLDGIPGKLGAVYDKHAGFCLETQHFPDGPNRKEFPDCVFGPDRKYQEKSVFSFDW
ncbi:MAG: galactose mutarotase [Treponema sp. GWB1_62_6]|nr:MAG: galactose mutarotase [Treponema sp. GWB1_62_6]OHE63776.1 MAG: galactose mutarotase [Treponema sp. GWC1_61_84]OHE68704.1 MAG: galactose mutarotase [Treponema sp. RIFOXYC1_FULL_61_9]HCM27981.1 galactose-1-epimerase [Treponema sp.]